MPKSNEQPRLTPRQRRVKRPRLLRESRSGISELLNEHEFLAVLMELQDVSHRLLVQWLAEKKSHPKAKVLPDTVEAIGRYLLSPEAEKHRIAYLRKQAAHSPALVGKAAVPQPEPVPQTNPLQTVEDPRKQPNPYEQFKRYPDLRSRT